MPLYCTLRMQRSPRQSFYSSLKVGKLVPSIALRDRVLTYVYITLGPIPPPLLLLFITQIGRMCIRMPIQFWNTVAFVRVPTCFYVSRTVSFCSCHRSFRISCFIHETNVSDYVSDKSHYSFRANTFHIDTRWDALGILCTASLTWDMSEPTNNFE